MELIGRTLKNSVPRLSPETLLETLKGEGTDALIQVSTPKDRLWRKDRIQGRLAALFRLAQLPEEETLLLMYALPKSSSGLDAEVLAGAPRLVSRGWLRRSGEDVLTLHPLVQETGWRELEVDFAALVPFALGRIYLPQVLSPVRLRFSASPDGEGITTRKAWRWGY